MNYLYQQRGTGKTSFLIKESARTGYPIAVATQHYADNVKYAAKNYLGIYNLPEPIVATKENCEKAEKYYIDEVGLVLQELLGGTPLLGSMSDDGDFVEEYLMKEPTQNFPR